VSDGFEDELQRQRRLHHKPSGTPLIPVWLKAYEKMEFTDSFGCTIGAPTYNCKDCGIDIDVLRLQQHWEWHKRLWARMESNQNTKGWYPDE